MMKVTTQLLFSLLVMTALPMLTSQTPDHIFVKGQGQDLGPFVRQQDSNIYLKVNAPASGFTHREVYTFVTQEVKKFKSIYSDKPYPVAVLIETKPHRQCTVQTFRFSPQAQQVITHAALYDTLINP